MKELTPEEQAFRRGYSQGWFNARHPDNRNITYQDVRNWRDDSEESPENYPPGSYQRSLKQDKPSVEMDPAFSQFSPN
jgi:hypothetical protein